MRSFSMTDKGKMRHSNQDFLFVSETSVGPLPNLFVVADGMGGHNAGDYASRYAVEVMVETIRNSIETEPAALFVQAVGEANRCLLERAGEDARLSGMGTTAVLACICQNRLWTANIGDSRLYRVNDSIFQVTRDHSLVEEMVRNGELKEAEARIHPDKNIITRAVGATKDADPDVFETELSQGDRILMCSDGLTNMVTDQEILTIMKDEPEPEQTVRTLINAANLNGGKDNITAIVIAPFTAR